MAESLVSYLPSCKCFRVGTCKVVHPPNLDTGNFNEKAILTEKQF